jgi:hypothetical protein
LDGHGDGVVLVARVEWDPLARRRPLWVMVVVGVLLAAVGMSHAYVGAGVVGGEELLFADGYWYRGTEAPWGWLNLAIGAVACVIGVSVAVAAARLARRPWLWRSPAVLVAVVSAVNQCFLAPQYPVLASVAVGVDAVIVWAVATQVSDGRHDQAEDRDRFMV